MDRNSRAPRRRPVIRIAIAGVLIPAVLITTAARGCRAGHRHYHSPTTTTNTMGTETEHPRAI